MVTRYLITGVTGFIGSELADLLSQDEGAEVYGMHRWRHDDAPSGPYHTVYANLQDAHAIGTVVGHVDPDVILHLGAISPVSESFDRPREYLQTNAMGTAALARAAAERTTNLDKFVFAGTPEEYGRQTEFPIKESVRCCPLSPYAVSKHAATTFLQYMADVEGFPAVIARHGNCYGRTRSSHFVVEAIVSQMANGNDTVRLGDPDPVRDFLYLDDVLAAYRRLIQHGEPGEIYNFGGSTRSIRGLVTRARDVTGYDGDVEWHTRAQRPGEIDRLEADDSKARQRLGWEQTVSLAEGLQRVAEVWGTDEHAPRARTA